MTGSTSIIEQPGRTGSILPALGVAAAVVGVAISVAWGATTFRPATSSVAAPAAIYAPAVRDLGARDQAPAVPAAG